MKKQSYPNSEWDIPPIGAPWFNENRGPISMVSVKKQESISLEEVRTALEASVYGQQEAVDKIVFRLRLQQNCLAPVNRPVGSFFLLGPTGTGKTHMVRTLAEVLHGNPRSVLTINCGEFQMEHEVAKLIGAPPGYLGHRETQPWITQQKVDGIASSRCPLAVILFDEFEKAAKSLDDILLGILDNGMLRLGDSSIVNLEKTLIFFTSNVGSREMEASRREIGLPGVKKDRSGNVALSAMRKRYKPEFLNRLDSIVVFSPLTRETARKVLLREVELIRRQVVKQIGCGLKIWEADLQFNLNRRAEEALLEEGFSEEYGAREIRRVVEKRLLPLLCDVQEKGWLEEPRHLTFGWNRGNLEVVSGVPEAMVATS